MSDREKHKARNWVEKNYPDAEGKRKSELIVAFGAGLDAGLAEAQEIVTDTVTEMLGSRP